MLQCGPRLAAAPQPGEEFAADSWKKVRAGKFSAGGERLDQIQGVSRA